MTNAAIFLHHDAFDTTGDRLMGRHSAGESFLRGFIRHADVDRFNFYNATPRRQADMQALVERIEPLARPARWIPMRNRPALADPGCLSYPSPDIPREAWARLPFGSHRYSLCGITHTTASEAAMDVIAEMATAPVQPWDGLICTSRAVRASVELQMEAVRQNLAERLGATRFPTPQLTTIPLGVNAADFAPSPEHRRAWRERLGIPEDAVVALYVGRLNVAAKMNPAMMAMALEEAAQRTGKPLYWIVSGWASTQALTDNYHELTRALCPSVHYRAVDGRPADTRFSIWSAADLFISFSDNIQETFGLTPTEAMAAGLPCVVTDWDGYRDTVRHGVDGFRIRTYAPRAGLGRDLAYYHANGWAKYELYLAAAAQMTAIDHQAAVEALVALVTDADLRRRMGEAGRRRAQAVFDWSAVIPLYQAFWGELAERRAQATAPAGGIADNPRRLDPFTLFQSYPTELLGPDSVLQAEPGMDWPAADDRLSGPLATLGAWALPQKSEMEQVFGSVAHHGEARVADLVGLFPPARHSFVERGLLWLVKYRILRVRPRAGDITD
ncbi:MAG: glycosyltransferase family 4 protein [Phenylobacterium sp.]|uniref:glycosyltransferase family 4 protein n=1 Tax=Phenylobacterium sp. TaxID=1871053 RepID=UPI00391D5DD2